jgi:hypothetical protein
MFWTGTASYPAGAEFEVRLELAGGGDLPPLLLELRDASQETDGFRRYVVGTTPVRQPTATAGS